MTIIPASTSTTIYVIAITTITTNDNNDSDNSTDFKCQEIYLKCLIVFKDLNLNLSQLDIMLQCYLFFSQEYVSFWDSSLTYKM
jgi:hypothetical protein